jgi:hypothetical protein
MIAIEQWHSWQNHQNSRNTSRTTEVGPSLYYHPLGGRLTESSITQNARTWRQIHAMFPLCSGATMISPCHGPILVIFLQWHLFPLWFSMYRSLVLQSNHTPIIIHNFQGISLLDGFGKPQLSASTTASALSWHVFTFSYIFLPCGSSEEKLFFVPPSPSRRVFGSFFTRIWVSYAWLSRTSLHR